MKASVALPHPVRVNPRGGLLFRRWLPKLNARLRIGLSIIGNAYIASGLIAASMIFYSERVESASSAAVASALHPS